MSSSLWTTVARQVPLSMGFSRQEYCGLPFPSPGDLSDPGIEPESLALTGRFFITSATWEALQCIHSQGKYPKLKYRRSTSSMQLKPSVTGPAHYKQIINALLVTYSEVYLPSQLLNRAFQEESNLLDWRGKR